jgi:hypothetical protein
MPALDPKYVENMGKSIDNSKTCDDLKKIKDAMEAQLTELLAKIQGSIDDLAGLIVKPDDPTKVITWIGKFIDKTILGPYNKALALQAEVLALQTQMLAKITAKISELDCHF